MFGLLWGRGLVGSSGCYQEVCEVFRGLQFRVRLGDGGGGLEECS